MEDLRHFELGEVREGWEGPSSIVQMGRLSVGWLTGAQSLYSERTDNLQGATSPRSLTTRMETGRAERGVEGS